MPTPTNLTIVFSLEEKADCPHTQSHFDRWAGWLQAPQLPPVKSSFSVPHQSGWHPKLEPSASKAPTQWNSQAEKQAKVMSFNLEENQEDKGWYKHQQTKDWEGWRLGDSGMRCLVSCVFDSCKCSLYIVMNYHYHDCLWAMWLLSHSKKVAGSRPRPGQFCGECAWLFSEYSRNAPSVSSWTQGVLEMFPDGKSHPFLSLSNAMASEACRFITLPTYFSLCQ